MTHQELLNPNLHLTLTVKLDCDNKCWRRNAAENADGDASFLTEGLKGALQDAVNEVLQRELGRESTAFAEYSCEIVDDDKKPIYAYGWCSPFNPKQYCERECTPMRNGEELPYMLRVRYVLERAAVTSGDADHCHPEEGHDEWRIEDKHGGLVDSGDGYEEDCQCRFEEIMEENGEAR